MGSRGPWCRPGKGVPASSPGYRVIRKGPLRKQETQRREGSGRQKKGTPPRMFPVNTGLCRTDQQVSFLGGGEGKLEVPSPGLRSCSPNSLVVPDHGPQHSSSSDLSAPPQSRISRVLSSPQILSPSSGYSLFPALCLSPDPRHTHLQPRSGLNVLLCQACDPRPR